MPVGPEPRILGALFIIFGALESPEAAEGFSMGTVCIASWKRSTPSPGRLLLAILRVLGLGRSTAGLGCVQLLVARVAEDWIASKFPIATMHRMLAGAKKTTCPAGGYFTAAADQTGDATRTRSDAAGFKVGDDAATSCTVKAAACPVGGYYTALDQTVDRSCTPRDNRLQGWR